MADKPQHERDEPLITAREFMEFLGVGRTKFWLDVRDGKIPPGIKLGTRTRRWTQADKRAVLTQTEA